MVKLGNLTVNVGQKVRWCKRSGCGYVFSDYLSSCPKCGGTDYMAKELTQEMVRDIERQQ